MMVFINVKIYVWIPQTQTKIKELMRKWENKNYMINPNVAISSKKVITILQSKNMNLQNYYTK